MKMQKRMRGLLLASAMLGVAFVANAATMTVSTYYPSPYGSYVNLDTTGNTNLATGGGAVVIGGGGAGTLTVNGAVTIAGANDLTLSAGQGLFVGGTRTIAVTNTAATVTGTMTTTGNVGIGGAVSGERLNVNGAIRAVVGAQSGVIPVSCDGTWCYTYAVYAP